MARPTKYDQPTADVILKAVAAGLPNKTAAELAGVSERTLYEWMRRGKAGEQPFVQFVQDIKRGQAEAVGSAMMVISEAAKRGTWQAAAWWLERRHPDEYGGERKRIRELEMLVAEITRDSAGSPLTPPKAHHRRVESAGKRGNRSWCTTRRAGGAETMGWELRPNGRRYLYRNRRVNGKPVKEYLAADDDFGFVMADDLRRIQKREAKVQRLVRKVEQAFRERIGGIVAAADAANDPLRVVADALLTVAGFRKHHRGEWRMNRDLKKLAAEIGKLKDKLGEPRPMIWYEPPRGDAEAVEVYDLARKGDTAAQAKLKELIRQRGWVDWVGDLGQQATRQLIIQATAGEKVWQEGVEQKVKAMNAELLGSNPGILERLLVRRVVNGWIAVHALELELTVRPPANLKSKAYLDSALGRAQKRMTQAIGELARLRRLQAPSIVAKLTFPPITTPPVRPSHV